LHCAAIESLPASPGAATSKTDESHKLRRTGADGYGPYNAVSVDECMKVIQDDPWFVP
jgi:hypothetical protein